MWVRLKDATHLPLGNKAGLLAQAAQAGLKVPEGFVLPHGEALPEAPIAGLMAVRSAFSAEDTEDQSLAGFFESILRVTPESFGTAAATVLHSASARPGDFRRDLLVMEMVNAEFAGVAFTEPAFADDLVNYTSGTAEGLVGGEEAGQSLDLPKRESPGSLPFERRLQKLLKEVRGLFGEGRLGWDIEWADDGHSCWLLQVRPVTRSPRRNESFTYANIREILPDPPSVLFTEVVLACAHDLYRYYRGFDPTLPSSRPLIEPFFGRPLFNLSLLTETMRHWGLPTRLVTDNIGGGAHQEYPLDLKQFLRKTPVLVKQGWSQMTAISQARKATREIHQKTAEPAESLAECGRQLTWLFAKLVTVMLNLTAALSAPLLLLRASGTLSEHGARHRSISTTLHTDLEQLRHLVHRHPEWHSALSRGETPTAESFLELWDPFLKRHGHRGIYESDISRPRYHEAPAPLLQGLLDPPRPPSPPPPRTPMGILTLPLWAYCAAVMRAREQWRYEAMRCYDRLRQRILQLNPIDERLFDLTLVEWKKLDSGWQPDSEFWAARQNQIEADRAIDLPHWFRRFQPLSFDLDGEQTVAIGVGLTRGKLKGKAWVLTQPANELPEGFEPETTILVARTIDAGWITTFSKVAGVVVELGGDLSHGSIILRELGIPAVTNVNNITRLLDTGQELELDACSGRVNWAADPPL